MAFAVVQHTITAQGTTDGSGNTTTPTVWPSNTTAGNLLVAGIIWNGNASPGGPTGWRQAVTLTNGTGNQTEIWYKSNCIASDAVPVWVFTAGVHYMATLAEISGASTITIPVDQSGSSTTGTGVAVAVGTPITAGSEFVYFVCGRKNTSAITALSWSASTASGSATFQADIDQLGVNGGASNVCIEHSWALSGASSTSPSVAPNYTGISGVPVNLVASFFAGAVASILPKGREALQAVNRGAVR